MTTIASSLRIVSHAPVGVWLAALGMGGGAREGEGVRGIAAADLRDVGAALEGDEEGYARLVRRYQQAIAGRMWKFTRDRGVLEELVQEVFVEAYFSLRGYRGTGVFGAWLDRIATRVGYRFWKRQKRARGTVALGDYDGAADDGSEERSAAEELQVVLGELSPRDRLVLTLMYWEDLPVAEIAQQTGWTQTMVKVQAHRARKRLRKLLEAKGILHGEDEG